MRPYCAALALVLTTSTSVAYGAMPLEDALSGVLTTTSLTQAPYPAPCW